MSTYRISLSVDSLSERRYAALRRRIGKFNRQFNSPLNRRQMEELALRLAMKSFGHTNQDLMSAIKKFGGVQ